ncbi:hypothetical protein [uncultured Mailhella sp.]|uniref:hypothetical protein n=1 Tax=uncultured Mailhella sp. TaxID=1981031 RepID=UPI0025D35AA4|nr:hypothetical protein [uncultured Mailhella sp.]
MKVTEQQIAERYAAMTDDDLAALDPAKLTPEAAALRAQELTRRGLVDTPAQAELRARRERAAETTRRKNHARQLAAVALVTAALFVEFVLARMWSCLRLCGAASSWCCACSRFTCCGEDDRPARVPVQADCRLRTPGVQASPYTSCVIRGCPPRRSGT